MDSRCWTAWRFPVGLLLASGWGAFGCGAGGASPSCTVGEAFCTCRADGSCAGGLACNSNELCVPTSGASSTSASGSTSGVFGMASSSSGSGAGGSSGSSTSGSSGVSASSVSASGSSGGCAADQVVCPKGCASLQTDVNNCGSCGYSCPSGPAGSVPTCVAGACSYLCPSPTIQCKGACVDPSTSTNSCGTCGHACTAPTSGCTIPACQSSQCTTQPDPSQNGATCSGGLRPNFANEPSGLCESGTCTPIIAMCIPQTQTLNYAALTLSNTNSIIVDTCKCNGNAMVYTQGTTSHSTSCTTCTEDRGAFIFCAGN
jgi:hypothetical protein